MSDETDKHGPVFDALWPEISEYLFAHWDPIGVNNWTEASNEYERYARELARMLCNGKKFEDMVTYLVWVLEDQMELPCNDSMLRSVQRVVTDVIEMHTEIARASALP